MAVVEAKIQTVDDMYRLIWTAIANNGAWARFTGTASAVLPAPIGSQSGRPPSCALLSLRRGERERFRADGIATNWRCIVLDKLRAVEFVEGSWKTAPNHSRPATCIVDTDI
jgi:hypothetical protein